MVPNGVARVEFILPRQPLPIVGGPIYPQVRSVTVRVHNNVAAAILDEMCCYAPGGALGRIVRETQGAQWQATPPPMIWLRADGTVIKRIGDIASASGITKLPTPGPETALSRAAERDLSTPNPVWITPRTGYPDTEFRVHFHVLLNGAEYFYSLTREGVSAKADCREALLRPVEVIHGRLRRTAFRSADRLPGRGRPGYARRGGPAVVRAARLRPQRAGPAGDLLADLGPLQPVAARIASGSANRLALIIAGLAIVIALAGVAANDPDDSILRGLLEGGPFLGGYAVLGRYLGIRR